jgi:dihydroflavonol-4-reductase
MGFEFEGPILMTGASGFVGSAVARLLASAGNEVRAIVRKSAPRENLEGLKVDLIEADLRDRAAIDAAMRGVKSVFHIAADYRLWARDPSEIVRNNVEMTGNVMEAALRAGVSRIVYTSSVATLAPTTDGSDSDETRPLTEEAAIGAYKRSKVAAERLVERMVREQQLPATIVNPSTPLGPRDIKPTPTGRIVVEAALGRIPAFVDTGLNLVHVDDVAAGHIAAFRFGKIGERYILGGENVSFATMLGDIAEMVGRKAPTIRLPRTALFPVAAAAEFIAGFTGREPMATVDGLRMSKHRMYFSSAKAVREIGYHFRPYQLALRDAVDWQRETGRLK